MGYFGGSSRFAGDPGLFDTLKRIGRTALGFTPLGGPISTAESFFQRPTGRFPMPRLGGRQPAAGGVTIGSDGVVRRKRRRINYGNTKALKRAMKRQDGFISLAKKALKGSNYTVVTRSSQAVAAAKRKAAEDRHHAQ